MSIVNRRNAVIGWATWTTVKRVAAMKAKRAATAATPTRDSGEPEGKKAVKVIAVLVAAAGAVVFWKKRHRDATDYDSLASEEIGVGGDVPPAE